MQTLNSKLVRSISLLDDLSITFESSKVAIVFRKSQVLSEVKALWWSLGPECLKAIQCVEAVDASLDSFVDAGRL